MSKAREPVSSETSSGEEKTHDSSSEEIESEPEQIRKSSAPPAAARKPQTPSAIMPAPSAKGKDKATVASASASASRSTRKRAVQDVNGTEATGNKKSKKSKKAEPEASEKKQLFQRIWSEADEIAILNGMLQFRAEKKSEPSDNFDVFFELIKKNLHFDATRAQLKDKIYRLKKKYTNKGKGNEGKGTTFTSRHEQEAYDLSEKVWGTENENEVQKTSGSGAKKANANGSGAENENPNGSEAEKENANGNGADKENRVEEANNIKDSLASERRSVGMRERLVSGLGDVRAVGDVVLREGEMGTKDDEEELKKLESEEIEVYARLFELKTQKAKLLHRMMKSSRGH
ncbi:DNA-binding storekeeper protein-related transcriptional regulator [Striga hermonthica]|uniref:DNA-binding storekeeper protein-related transcriptional regulator n=1 Tax=Striga hermonthica TaxID=68872 RepID=A0A9N7MX30_STRHE|nr:DNA-binding storekeeper protein-related transcriptional regulator [Striga hermonthica]